MESAGVSSSQLFHWVLSLKQLEASCTFVLRDPEHLRGGTGGVLKDQNTDCVCFSLFVVNQVQFR